MSTSKRLKVVSQFPDGAEAVVRAPGFPSDMGRMCDFFRKLPAHTRNCLRYDVTDENLCRSRMKLVDDREHWRLIAEIDDEIVGDASLDREPYGWSRHVGVMRVVLMPRFELSPLEMLLSRQMVAVALRSDIERICTELFREQEERIRLLEELGFKAEAVRKKYAKDLKGDYHDVVILSNDIEEIWKRLEENIIDMDIELSSLYGGA